VDQEEDSMAEGMNDPLRDAYESIRDLLAHANRAEVRTRPEIGAIIARVKRSTLAETWTRPQMEAPEKSAT
jgi:hypothetical protein